MKSENMLVLESLDSKWQRWWERVCKLSGIEPPQYNRDGHMMIPIYTDIPLIPFFRDKESESTNLYFNPATKEVMSGIEVNMYVKLPVIAKNAYRTVLECLFEKGVKVKGQISSNTNLVSALLGGNKNRDDTIKDIFQTDDKMHVMFNQSYPYIEGSFGDEQFSPANSIARRRDIPVYMLQVVPDCVIEVDSQLWWNKEVMNKRGIELVDYEIPKADSQRDRLDMAWTKYAPLLERLCSELR